MELFDHIDGAIGMDLDTEVIEYEYGGKAYQLQLWKGNYGYGQGYGGEIGLYSKDINDSSGWVSSVSGENEIRTSQTIYAYDKKTGKQGDALMTHDTATAPGGIENGDSFWNLMIRMEDDGYTKETLMQESTLYIEDEGMQAKIIEAINGANNPQLFAGRKGNQVIIKFGGRKDEKK